MIFGDYEYEVLKCHALGGVTTVMYRTNSKWLAILAAWWYKPYTNEQYTFIMKRSYDKYSPWLSYKYGKFK